MSESLANGVAEAVAAAGGVARLAKLLGLSHPSLIRWQRNGRIPIDRVASVEAATGIPRHRLRPDIFGRPDTTPEGRIPLALAAEAVQFGLDPDAIAAKALHDAVRAEKARRWQEENREAMDAWNAWTDANELPLAKYRLF
jgi:post-segregation antitoxin (ccd killing protein)